MVGLSILSGSHLPLVRDVMTRMAEAGLGQVPVIVGGIVPDFDLEPLRDAGVAAVLTPGATAEQIVNAALVAIA